MRAAGDDLTEVFADEGLPALLKPAGEVVVAILGGIQHNHRRAPLVRGRFDAPWTPLCRTSNRSGVTGTRWATVCP